MREETHWGRTMRCFEDRPAHLNALFARTLARHPDSEALVCGEKRITYAGLDTGTARVAAGLARACPARALPSPICCPIRIRRSR